jgi:hypothetical protein
MPGQRGTRLHSISVIIGGNQAARSFCNGVGWMGEATCYALRLGH